MTQEMANEIGNVVCSALGYTLVSVNVNVDKFNDKWFDLYCNIRETLNFLDITEGCDGKADVVNKKLQEMYKDKFKNIFCYDFGKRSIILEVLEY